MVYSRSKATASLLHEEARKTYPEIALYSEDTPGSTLDDLLKRNDISAVIIVLPIPIQPDIIRRCLSAGKHVLAEKPLAKDVSSGRALIEECRKTYAPKGLIFSIAEQFRYMEPFAIGRKWIVDERAVGRLTQLHLRVWRNIKPGGKYIETAWRKVPEYQGGFILDGGVHHVALIRYVSGEEIVETKSFARQVVPHLPPVDTINTAILLSGGGTGTVSFSFASARQGMEALFIGEKGSLAITESKSGSVLKLELLDGTRKEETVKDNGVVNEIRAFLEAVRVGKAEAKAGPEQAMNDLAFVESICQEGVKTGVKVENW